VLYCGGSEKPREAGIPTNDLGRHPSGDELSGAAEQARCRREHRQFGLAVRTDPCQRQACGGVGGGDTASDCVGTAFRQGAVRVTQLDIRPQPPEKEDKLAVWPYWATKMRTSSSQAEGAQREFQVARWNSSARTAF
jgi:glutamate synthase (NADPH/NADH) small chain